MTTEIIKISDVASEAEKVKHAASILADGGLVAIPTETVYGLGALATDENAAKKIYAAKGRPSDNPLIIHISEPADAEKYGLEDKQVVTVKIESNGRSLIFDDVVVRVNPNFALAMHIDTDESNAAGAVPGLKGEIL